VEETAVSCENYRYAANHWQLFPINLYQVHLKVCRNKGQNISDDRHRLHMWMAYLLLVLNATFNIFSLHVYHGGCLIGGGNCSN